MDVSSTASAAVASSPNFTSNHTDPVAGSPTIATTPISSFPTGTPPTVTPTSVGGSITGSSPTAEVAIATAAAIQAGASVQTPTSAAHIAGAFPTAATVAIIHGLISEKWPCKRCMTRNAPNALRCRACGWFRPLSTDEESKKKADEQKKKIGRRETRRGTGIGAH